MTDVTYLTFEQLVAGARHIIGPDAVLLRDPGLLKSAAYRPSTVAFGTEAYPTMHEKAAALLHSLVANHPYLDGNKRMGWAATEVFYRLNGWRFTGKVDDAFDLTMSVARSEIDVPEIAEQLARLFAEGSG